MFSREPYWLELYKITVKRTLAYLKLKLNNNKKKTGFKIRFIFFCSIVVVVVVYQIAICFIDKKIKRNYTQQWKKIIYNLILFNHMIKD